MTSSQSVRIVEQKETDMINEYTIGVAIAGVVILAFFGGWGWLTSRRKGKGSTSSEAV